MLCHDLYSLTRLIMVWMRCLVILVFICIWYLIVGLKDNRLIIFYYFAKKLPSSWRWNLELSMRNQLHIFMEFPLISMLNEVLSQLPLAAFCYMHLIDFLQYIFVARLLEPTTSSPCCITQQYWGEISIWSEHGMNSLDGWDFQYALTIFYSSHRCKK